MSEIERFTLIRVPPEAVDGWAIRRSDTGHLMLVEDYEALRIECEAKEIEWRLQEQLKDRALARVTELEAANTGLATEAQRLKAGLRFYARGLHFSPGDAICWDDVSGEPPNFLCDEYGTTIEDGTIAKDVLLGRDGAWPGEDWPPDDLPEETSASAGAVR